MNNSYNNSNNINQFRRKHRNYLTYRNWSSCATNKILRYLRAVSLLCFIVLCHFSWLFDLKAIFEARAEINAQTRFSQFWQNIKSITEMDRELSKRPKKSSHYVGSATIIWYGGKTHTELLDCIRILTPEVEKYVLGSEFAPFLLDILGSSRRVAPIMTLRTWEHMMWETYYHLLLIWWPTFLIFKSWDLLIFFRYQALSIKTYLRVLF